MNERIKELMKMSRAMLLAEATDLGGLDEADFAGYTKRDLAVYVAEAGQ